MKVLHTQYMSEKAKLPNMERNKEQRLNKRGGGIKKNSKRERNKEENKSHSMS